MKRNFILIGFVIFISACGQTISVWQKAGTTPEQEQLDYKNCVFEANKHSQEGLLSESAQNERIKKLRDLCFESKGYKLISRKSSHPIDKFIDSMKK